jgi:hypothetical protein
MNFRLFLPIAVALLSATPASAQFSDSYNFLKAVRERDGNKATEFLSRPGTVIVDTRDSATGEAGVHIVTRARDLTWLTFLLQKGAKPDLRDGRGNTALMIASQIGFLEGAQQLLKFRATVDVANSAGETPLITAVQTRNAAMVRLLMLAGANPNRADSAAGLSAKDYAARDRRSAAILKIIEETKPTKSAGAAAGPKL